MQEIKDIQKQLTEINEKSFEEIALRVFNFQYKNNLLYRTYADILHLPPSRVNSLADIPFLPISFFKTHTVKSGTWDVETEFSSSGTTGAVTSRHPVMNLDFYLHHSIDCFEYFLGPVSDYHFLVLLPSYLERTGSSLVAMMDHFIRQDKTGHSGFYLNNESELLQKAAVLKGSTKKTIVWGVSFALLYMAERYDNFNLSHCLVFETGGMKGRRKEMIRDEFHSFLCDRFKVQSIYSEYGMTELMSQAYSFGNGYFQCAPWMKVMLRDINDPFEEVQAGKVGAINVIDLGNIHSCSFIETEDLGRVVDSDFEILGRMDNSDMRGCNLLLG